MIQMHSVFKDGIQNNEAPPTSELKHSELLTLKNNNKLIVGTHYIISDYRTEYYIEGSDTSGIVSLKKITSVVSNYAVLNNDYTRDLQVGDTVSIKTLPNDYTGALTLGDETTVSAIASEYYVRFTNGMHGVLGLELEFSSLRYESVDMDDTIYDLNGNIVMKKEGLINTEVHNGNQYMNMSSDENLNVPIEKIRVVAATSNSFEKQAFSGTHLDDTLEYDIEDTEIRNSNDKVIGSRKGLIKRRYNKIIDMPLDWRVIRFRRWLIDESSRRKFINSELTDEDKLQREGKFLYTSQNRAESDTDCFYIAKEIEGEFLTVNPDVEPTPFTFTVVSLSSAKDFSVIPSNGIKRFIAKESKIENSIFFNQLGELNENLDVYLDNTVIKGCSFFSSANMIVENSSLEKLYCLDTIYLKLDNTTINHANFLSFTSINGGAYSTIKNSIFGSLTENLTGLVIPTTSWIYIENLQASTLENFVYGSRLIYLKIINSVLKNSDLFMLWDTERSNGFTISNCSLNNFSLNLFHYNKNFILGDSLFSGTEKQRHVITSSIENERLITSKDGTKLYKHLIDESLLTFNLEILSNSE